MSVSSELSTGLLVLAGTPIGNASDASPALARQLAEADVIAAEDTRRLARLLADLQVTTGARKVSFFEGNERARIEGLLDDLRGGATVVVVTDAGMPSISDPGYRLVAAAVEAGVAVTCTPGPSAVLTALAVSGLAVDRFCFEGFPPRRAGELRRTLAALAAEPRTMVFFESPHRVAATLAAMTEEFGGNRPAAVCRELTKTHEEVRRGPLAELTDWAGTGKRVRGEITIVVAGSTPAVTELDDSALAGLVAELEGGGLSRRDAVAEVARRTGVARRTVYNAAVAR